jgi:IclR family transcriptional regulator, KDG regulon repressor
MRARSAIAHILLAEPVQVSTTDNICLTFCSESVYNVKHMRKEASDFAGVLVLHKTLDVLEALHKAPAGLSLAELTAELRMPKPTIFRILATLESRAYLDRTSAGEYRIGRKLAGDGAEGIPDQASIIRAARPEMQKLLASCKETLNLGLLDGGEVLVVETLESPQAVRMSSKIGNRRHPHSTALGKVLLAGLSDKDAVRIVKALGMPAFTSHTITSADQLVLELERVRTQGWSMDNRENEPDGRCIAAPIHCARRVVVAALSISGPLPRMTMTRAKSLLPELLQTAARVSASIGGHVSHR